MFLLFRVERNRLGQSGGLFAVTVEKPFDHITAEDSDTKDLLGVFRPHAAIENALRLNGNERPAFTESLTARTDQIQGHLEINGLSLSFAYKGAMDLGAARGKATRSATDAETHRRATPFPDGTAQPLQRGDIDKARHDRRSFSRISPRRPFDLP